MSKCATHARAHTHAQTVHITQCTCVQTCSHVCMTCAHMGAHTRHPKVHFPGWLGCGAHAAFPSCPELNPLTCE